MFNIKRVGEAGLTKVPTRFKVHWQSCDKGGVMAVSESREKNGSERIFADIVEEIANGSYASGERLPTEHIFKEKYGVSRNTIRSVLNRLAALGLIETKRGHGSYVRQAGPNVSLTTLAPSLIFQQHHLVDILEFRKGIEVYAVRLAAQRCSEDDIKKLHACLKRMKNNLENMQEFQQADKDMHLIFARASKNAMFISMLEIVYNVLTVELSTMLHKQGKDIDSYFYHRSIVDCIEAGKPDEAAFMMEKHLSLIIDRVRASSGK